MDGLDSLSTLMWNAMHPYCVAWFMASAQDKYGAWMVRSNRRHIRYRTYQQLPGQKRANRKSKENQGIGQHLPLANEECVSYG
ncbi:CWF19-like protein [Trichinella spiralis]|uniref:CWF19-like protein n=1 Tax=Trichinella spiralis TaxID=6334 RepID=A0ABR3KM06_TRISP